LAFFIFKTSQCLKAKQNADPHIFLRHRLPHYCLADTVLLCIFNIIAYYQKKENTQIMETICNRRFARQIVSISSMMKWL
jgi:hypothetical protein